MGKVKITDLTALTIPDGSDLVEIVDDPGGTPVSKKITVTNLLSLVAAAPSIYDATIGAAGADYETISAAITAGKSKLLVVDNVTEVADVNVPDCGEMIITIPGGKTVTMGTYRFLWAQVTDLTISGSGVLSTSAAVTNVFDITTTYSNSILTLRDINLSVTPTTISKKLNSYGVVKVFNVNMTFSNKSDIGFMLKSTDSIIKDCVITGGGSSCHGIFDMYAGKISGLEIKGRFAAAATIEGLTSQEDIIVENIAVNLSDASYNVSIQIKGIINGIICEKGEVSITILGDGTKISNVVGSLTDADSKISVGTYSNCTIQNCQIYSIILTNPSVSNNLIVNCRLNNTSVTGDYNRFSNCILDGNLALNAADDNAIVNCKINGTTVIAAGANRTLMSACHVNTAPTDGGTDSSLDYVVY